MNGAEVEEAENGKATLTYTATEKKLNIHLDASISAKIPADNHKYGVQSISIDGDVLEPYIGSFVIVADIVRATQ